MNTFLLWCEVAVPRCYILVDNVPLMYVLQSCKELQAYVDTLVGGHGLVAAREPPFEVTGVEVLVDHHWGGAI